MYPYWKKQTLDKPLFPDIEWSKPEQKSLAGRLGIIGGNKLGFTGVAEAYTTALSAGVGETRVLLPDALRKTIPAVITDVVFAASNPSGSLAKDALIEALTLGSWSSGMLLVGDAGRNSETAILYENFINQYNGQLTITRDAIDLVKNSNQLLVERPNTMLVLSFAQLQKLFQSVYYPKILTFSMQLAQLVEALHKFTITYPVEITVLHKDHIVIAGGGEIITADWNDPMRIWRGTVASQIASYMIWNPNNHLAAAVTAIGK